MAIFSRIFKRLILEITNKRVIALLLIVISAISCINSQPVKDYNYKELNIDRGLERDSVVVLAIEFDTTSTQELYLSAVIRNNLITTQIDKIPLEIKVISPSKLERIFIIDLPLNITKERNTYRKSNGIIEIEWPLLKSIKSCESGEYTINIKQSKNLLIYKNILGIGVRSAKEKN